MNPDEEHARLRASFSELRREDARLAPPFERDWATAVRLRQQARLRRSPLPRAAAAVAAIAAAGVAAALLLNSRPGRDGLVAGRQPPTVAATPAPEHREQEAPASIEDWESPTAALLELSLEDGSTQGHRSAPIRGGGESF